MSSLYANFIYDDLFLCIKIYARTSMTKARNDRKKNNGSVQPNKLDAGEKSKKKHESSDHLNHDHMFENEKQHSDDYANKSENMGNDEYEKRLDKNDVLGENGTRGYVEVMNIAEIQCDSGHDEGEDVEESVKQKDEDADKPEELTKEREKKYRTDRVVKDILLCHSILEKNKSSCDHARDFLNNCGLIPFKIIYECYVVCLPPGSRAIKAKLGACFCCESLSRIHACMTCIYFACYPVHIKEHAEIMHHHLSVSLSHGTIYCNECRDYIYDENYEVIARQILVEAKKASPVHRRLKLVNFMQPTIFIVDELKGHKVIKLDSNTTIGLRGLADMGNTCFINCILQVLLHAPLLRNYFFYGLHSVSDCDNNNCVACEMFVLFQAFYNGGTMPLIPHQLYITMFQNGIIPWQAEKPAGDQQDAHEFLTLLLDKLHEHCGGLHSENCACIIHRSFAGSIRSEIKCRSCNDLYIKVDPIREIYLELFAEELKSQGASRRGGNKYSSVSSSVLRCLQRYTSVEHLEGSTCSICNAQQQRTKQTSILEIPVILMLHFNRLEYNHSHGSERGKNQTYVEFPETLDLTPFTTDHILGNKKDILDREENIYHLFAVVSHKGVTGSCGHYIAFIRYWDKKWYKCNHHIIQRASVEEIHKSECYMLFYHRKIVPYAPV